MAVHTLAAILKRMKSRLTRRLANKLVLIFSGSISLFVVALILVSYFRTTDIIKNEYIANNSNTLSLINQNMIDFIKQIDDFSLIPRKDMRFLNYLMEEDYSFAKDSYIQDTIRNMFNVRQDIQKIRVTVMDDNRQYAISRSYANPSVSTVIPDHEREQYNLAIQNPFFRTIESGYTLNGSRVSNDNVFLTFNRVIINIADKAPLCMISIDFDYSIMDLMSNSQTLQNGEIICLFDQTDSLFYTSSADESDLAMLDGLLPETAPGRQSGNFHKKLNGQDYYVVYFLSENGSWKTAKLIPVSVLNGKVSETRNISLIMGSVFLVVIILLILFISNIITGSLRRLSRQMDSVGEGNFNVQAEIRGNDEIAYLSIKFNDMVNQIDSLVNDKYKAELSEKTARLKALEAQVNPHFLYNSLQAISSRAIAGGMKDISKMLEALALSLRYCIKGSDMVRISQEIEHVRNYLILHKARFEDRLSVEILVEDSTRDQMIPKLSIHTLVENSIKHCLEQIAASISIGIYCYQTENQVIIKVTDNGPGMTPTKLGQVREEMVAPAWLRSGNEPIGLNNLYARLRLMYNEKFEMIINSQYGQGTEIRIILPYDAGGVSHV